jgi:hypothetical protein
MNTEETKLGRLVEDVFATLDTEIQCQEAENLIARCSDALLNDEDTILQYPQLQQHLALCPDCAEEYRAVIALARAEAENRLAQIPQIPPVPVEKESKIGSNIEAVLSSLFRGFSSKTATAVMRGEESIVEPVTIDFPEGNIEITLDAAPSLSYPDCRDLYCTITTEDDTLSQHIEGASIWLQTSEGRKVTAEKTLDELGDALFESLPTGVYDLRLFLARKEYRINRIEVP